METRLAPAVLWVDNTPGGGGDIFTATGGTQPASMGGLTPGVNIFSTVGAAITAANPNDTINVADGIYSELITVNKSLTIQGNQFGVDARTRGAVAETIVDASAIAAFPDTSFHVQAGVSGAIIDGFTVQGVTGSGAITVGGIYLAAGSNGTTIRNNVIQNNHVGIFLANNSASNQTVIETNLFRNNTAVGAASGHDIYADEFTAGAGMQNVLIDSNTFTNTSLVVNSWSLGISNTGAAPFTNITYSNNVVTNHGRGMYFFNTDGATISGNEISGASNYAIGVFTALGTDNNANFAIRNNKLTNSNRGVWVDGYTGNLDVNYNDLSGNAIAGVQNDDAGSSIDARINWWGSATGPTSGANPGGTGAAITGTNGAGVAFAPFLVDGTDTMPGVPGFQPAVTTSTLPAGGGNFEAILDGADLVVRRVGGPEITRVPAASVTFLHVVGTDASNETFTVNYAVGGFFDVDVLFDGGVGGADNDALVVNGGVFTTATHNFTTTGPEHSGNIVYNTGVATATVNYTGLEPIDMSGSDIDNLVFNLPGTNDQAILEDAGVGGDGDSQIRSQRPAGLGGPTFDTTIFANPNVSLTINMGGDSGTLTVANLPDYVRTLIINGQAGADNVIFTGPVNLSGAGADLTVNVGGTITDNAATSLIVLDVASLSAAAITLGENAADITNFGSLTFNSTGQVTITEDSATVFTGANTANGLAFTSVGSITDAAGTNITVNNTASFNATSILLGDNLADVQNFGSLTVISTGSVTINEDSNTVFGGSSTVNSLTINSSGNISDDLSGDISVAGLAIFNGGTGVANVITLGDNTGNDSNFGSLTFTLPAGVVTILEDSDTVLAGVNTAGTLNLTALGSLTDAPTTSLTVTGAASLVATSITLGDSAGDAINFSALTTSTAAGNQSITETNGIIGLSLSAGAGTITLFTGGALADTDTADDFTAADLILQAASGIGTGANPINSNVNRLDVRNTTSGGIFITDTTSGLTLINLGGADANAVSGVGGGGQIRANSPLIISSNAITSGGMTYTAGDSAATGDDLTVVGLVTVQDTSAALVFNAGDNLNLNPTSIINATTTLTLNLDAGDADGGGEIANINGNISAGTAPITLIDSADANVIVIDSNGGTTNNGGTVDNVLTNLLITGNGGADTLTLDDSGDVTGDTAAISNSGAGDGTISGLTTASIAFIDLSFVTINLSNGPAAADGDAITVTPNAATTFVIIGNNPAAFPGDLLTYNGSGTKNITGVNSGSITGPGVQPVNFSNFERVSATAGNLLNDVIDLSTPPLSTAGGQDGTPNQVLLRRDATGTFLEILIDFNTNDNGGVPNPVLHSTQLYSAVGTITVTGGTDVDRLVVNNSNGLVNRTINFSGGLPTNSGEPNGDALSIVGTPAGGLGATARETYLVGVTEDAGTWVIDPDGSRGAGLGVAGNGDEMTINFTGLEPADSDTAVAVFDLIMNLLANQATIENGGVLNGSPSLQVTDNNGTFETTRFANKTVARIMGQSGGDGFRLNYSINAAGLTRLEVYGHLAAGVAGVADDNGSDEFEVDAENTAAVNLFGQGGSDYFTNSNTGGTFTYAGAGPLNLDGLAIGTTISIDGGAGATDVSRLQDSNDATADTVTLTSTALTGASPAVINYVGLETFLYEGSSGGDTINIPSTASGTQYYVTGDGGADTITVGNTLAGFGTPGTGSLDSILGLLMMTGEFNPPSAGAVDTINIDDSGTAALAGVGNIDRVGAFNFSLAPFGPTDSGEATQLTGFAPAPILYRHTVSTFTTPDVTYNNRVEFVNIRASAGADLINVNATTATNTTTLDGYLGNDTISIKGNNLSANNVFLGNEGNDRFNLDILNIPLASNLGANAFATLTSLIIDGGAGVGGAANNSANRDSLTINDASGTPRALNFNYLSQTSGDLNVLGFPNLAAAPGVQVRTMETVVSNSAGDLNTISVTGTTLDDDITVVPFSASRALVFLGYGSTDVGGGWDGPPDSFFTTLPGVAGGSFGPDLLLNNINPATVLQVFGGGNTGAGDQLFVDAPSENPVIDPVTEASTSNADPFGLNGLGAPNNVPGVIIPGFGVGNAFDDIGVNLVAPQTTLLGTLPALANGVTIINNSLGQLLRVQMGAVADFVQTPPVGDASKPGLIANSGFEAGVRPGTFLADDIYARIAPSYYIRVNGGDPTAAVPGPDAATGAPRGDQLNVTMSGDINVYSDNAATPNVTVQDSAIANTGITFSSIERAQLSPGTGVVNIIGDNNDPAVTQDDYYRVRGEVIPTAVTATPAPAVNAFSLQIGTKGASRPALNLSSKLYFTGVHRINAFGGSVFNGTINDFANPQIVGTGIDTLDITPYADNTPQGWGIETFFNEGDPITDGDLIIFNGVVGVSDQIVIQPSALEAGQVYSINAATGTPIAVVNYTLNTEIDVNGNGGALGETDSLTLRGTNPDNPDTSGNDFFVADFTNAGTSAAPMVTVRDDEFGPSPIIYVLRNFTNFDTINLESLGGRDVFHLVGRDDGSLRINVDGGAGFNYLELDATTGNDHYSVSSLEQDDNFGLLVISNNVFPVTQISYRNIVRMTSTALGLHTASGDGGSDTLDLFGNTNSDAFELTTSQNDDSGFVQLNDFTFLFNSLGSSGDGSIRLFGGAGSDQFILNHSANWEIGTVQVSSSDPASATVLLNGSGNAQDLFTFTPTSATFGTINVTSPDPGGLTTEYSVVGNVTVDGREPVTADADALVVTTTNAVITPGSTPGTGVISPVDAIGNPLLGLTYRGIESASISGGTAVIQGTSENDTISVSATGVVTVTNLLGFNNSFDLSGFNSLVINALGGDDSITIASSALFAGGVTVIGGEPGAGSDSLVLNGTAGNDAINVNLVTGNATGVVGGPVVLNGIEHLIINGNSAVTGDSFTVDQLGTLTGIQTVLVNANGLTDSVNVIGTSGPDVLNYRATSATAGEVTNIGAATTLNFTGVDTATGSLTIQGVGDGDTLIVNGTTADDEITVTSGVVTVELPGPTTYLPINYANFDSLIIRAGTGSDTIDVTPLVDTAIFVDGGDPIGLLPGDLLIVQSGGSPVTFTGGPEKDEGGIQIGGNQAISYDHIESVSIVGGGPVTLSGTNGDDAITIIARDASTHAGADGVQDFTVSVNDGPEFLFIDTPVFNINALGGDDTITVRAPAPNGAVWNVALQIDGGPPTASDKVVIETLYAGNEDVLYVPTGANSGILTINSLNSPIILADVEELIYNGTLDDADTLTVAAQNAAIVPGANVGDGVIHPVDAIGNAFLSLTYLHVPRVIVLGNAAVIQGTSANDTITVSAAGVVTATNALGFNNVIDVSAFSILVINALGGDDAITIQSSGLFGGGITVIGGEPGAGSDSVTVNDTNAILNFAGPGSSTQLTQVVGGPITLNGVEVVNINGTDGVLDAFQVLSYGTATDVRTLNLNGGDTNNNDGDTIDVIASAGPDTIRYTSWSATAARMERVEGAPVVNINGFNNADNSLSLDAGPNVDTVQFVGSASNDLVQVIQGGVGTRVTLTANGAAGGGAKWVPLDFSSVNALAIDAGAGNDRIDVDNTGGLVNLASGVAIDGNTGSDLLRLIGTTAVTSDIYTVGPNAGSGSIVQVASAVTQAVFFSNFEPVIDLVAGPLTVVGTNASNAITYVAGPNSGLTNVNNPTGLATGQVSVDGFETIEFANKTTLTINALAGDDTINLANSGTPAGLTGIVINGAPTADSDVLIVTGTTGNDVIGYLPSNTIGAGQVTRTGAVNVNFTLIESVTIDGQGGTDALTLTTPAGIHQVLFTPGAAPDSGSIETRGSGPGTTLVPLTFRQIGAAGSITFVSGAGAREDVLELYGTNDSDVFTVNPTGLTQITNPTGGFVTVALNTGGINLFQLRALNGDDTFNLAGPLPFASVLIDAGGPSASDVVNLNGAAAAVTVSLSTNSVTGFGPIITLLGVEVLNADVTGNAFTVFATLGNDTLNVTPTATNAATVALLDSVPAIAGTPVVNGTNIGAFNVNLLGGSDHLIVNGNQNANFITVTGALVTVDATNPASAAFETVNYLGVEFLQVNAQAGDDTINVTPSTTTSIFVDGGDPIGDTAGDTIVNNPVGFYITESGPENDEGGINNPGQQRVSWDHIEEVVIVGGGPVLILGTNGDDDITIIARDNSTHALANGVQDFTVSVNAGPSILYVNQPVVLVDALAGDDDIVVREPAPNNAVWNVQVYIAGGTPAAVTGDQGDVVELETPGTQTVTFTPNPAAIAPLVIGGATITPTAGGIDTAILTDATNTSPITIAPFVLTIAAIPFTYTSSPGGVEQIIYQGLAGGDNLTINGTSADDTTTINPTGAGSGTFRSSRSPAFDFTGASAVTVNGGTGGFDVVNINGTAGIDTVTSTATTVSFAGAGSVNIGAGMDRMNLSTLESNDSVILTLGVAGLDKVIFAGAGNDTVDLSGVTTDGTIFGGDGNDTLIGSPTADTIDGGAGDDILFGMAGDDVIVGGDGNDRFGEPAVRNTVANDAGNDRFFGGAGSDEFFWDPGDGDDVIEGGAGDADQILFFGNAGAEQFFVFADVFVPSRSHIFRVQGSIDIDAADVEEININPLGGTDTVTVGRSDSGVLSLLTTTTVNNVDVSLGADGAADNVIFEGRAFEDNLFASVSSGIVKVEGMTYNLRLDQSDPALDRLTVSGNEGNDTIKANAGVEAAILITLNGNDGNDFLSADAILNGGAGNDFLEGGSGVDTLNGGAGEDTMIGNGGLDTFDGGADFDTILIRGTSGNDNIDVNQSSATTLTYTVTPQVGLPFAETDTLVTVAGVRTVEAVRIEAGAGADLIRATWADSLGVDGVVNSLRMEVVAGADFTQDRLNVHDDGIGDLTLLRHGAAIGTGTVTIGPGNAEPLELTYQDVERVDITPIDPVTPLGVTPNGGRLVVFHSDPHEFNDSRLQAGQLARVGQSSTSPNVDPGASAAFGLNGDEDWYEFRPAETNTYQVKILFDRVPTLPSGRPGLPGTGDLSLDIYDANGALIVSGVADVDGNNRTAVFGATNDPAFPQFNRIFVRVKGEGAQPTLSINRYDFDNLSGVTSGVPGVTSLDLVGPQVTGGNITDDPATAVDESALNIFAPKPTSGPTPLVSSIEIHFTDNPERAPGFIYGAINAALFGGDTTGLQQNDVAALGLFNVVGDRVGNVPIIGISLLQTVTQQGVRAEATVTLFFDTTSPLFSGGLPDDRYTLIILDGLIDPAGNEMDGESNAAQPISQPAFPSGNGQAGGNFVARFTVNSRPDIGVYGNGTQQLDVNGNGFFDLVNAKDIVNSDKTFAFGSYIDNVFAGNFAPAGQLGNGFSKLGAYAKINGQFRWQLSFGGIASNIYTVVSGLQINGLPLAYHFNPALPNTDEIALFDGNGHWYIDYNHTNNLTGSSMVISNSLRGHPVVGDFDGDGNFDLATYQPDTNIWQFDLNPLTNHRVYTTMQWGFAGVNERPIAADMNRDGITDIGLMLPVTTLPGLAPTADWYFLESPGVAAMNGQTPGPASPFRNTINALAHPFNPGPFSQDQSFHFGNGLFRPIVGTWDPPAPAAPNVVKLAPGTFTDVTVSAEVESVPTGGNSGLVARRSANGLATYWAGVVSNNSGYSAQIKLLKNGVWQVLASTPSVAFTPGSTLTFAAVGTSLTLSINGADVLAVSNAALKTAGSAGSISSAGTTIWPAKATAVIRSVAALPYSDGFSQTDGSLPGVNWNVLEGNYRVQGSTLHGLATSNVAVINGISQSDVIQSIDILTVPAGGSANLVARYNPATGAQYRAGISAAYSSVTRITTYTAQIWRKYNTTWTLLASVKVPAGAGKLTFATIGNSMQLFLGDTLIAAATDKFIKTGYVGISATKGAALDNYAAITPSFSSATLPFSDSFFAGPMPGAWYANEGGFKLGNNGLLGMAASNVMTLYGVSRRDVVLEASAPTMAGGASAGVLARYNAATGNAYWAGFVAVYNATTKTTTYAAQIRRRIGGVWTVLMSKNVGSNPGTLRFTVSDTSLSLAVNGITLGTVKDVRISAAGAVGIFANKNGQIGSFSAL